MTAGFLLRLAFGLGYWIDKPLTHDEREYLALARSLRGGEGLRYPVDAATRPDMRFSRAPGYPAFLAVVGGRGITHPDPTSSPTSVKVAQSLVGAVAIALIASLAWRIRGPEAGAIAALVAAGYPPLVWICAYVLSETVYSTLGLATILGLARLTDEPAHAPRPRATLTAVGAGVLAGCAALTRPVGLIFLGLAAAWLATRSHRILAAALVAGALVVVGPWTARNVREHGRLVLVSAQGGVNFWVGNHPLALGDGDLSTNPALGRANAELRRRHAGLTAEELEPIYYREALAGIADDPLAWLALLVRKLFYLWVPIGPSYTARSTLYLWSSVVSYGLTLPFAVLGIRRLWRSGRTPIALALAVSSVVLASLLFFPSERFRIPVIDPALIVCASAWGSDRLTRRRS